VEKSNSQRRRERSIKVALFALAIALVIGIAFVLDATGVRSPFYLVVPLTLLLIALWQAVLPELAHRTASRRDR
jgi:predicted MFS family arabinose efflux permease